MRSSSPARVCAPAASAASKRASRSGSVSVSLNAWASASSPSREGERRVDGLLGEPHRVRRERRDAPREPFDERTDLVGGQRAVDPAVALRGRGIEVVAAEHGFERAATEQAPEPLRRRHRRG